MKKRIYTVILYSCFPISILVWFSTVPIAVFICIIANIFLYIKDVDEEKSFDIVFGIFLNIMFLIYYLFHFFAQSHNFSSSKVRLFHCSVNLYSILIGCS